MTPATSKSKNLDQLVSCYYQRVERFVYFLEWRIIQINKSVQLIFSSHPAPFSQVVCFSRNMYARL
jgi:hypothetical protein